MGLLIVLGILGLIIWAVASDNAKRRKSELSARNQQWIDFIAGYGRVAKSAKDKALVARMLTDIAQQKLGEPTVPFTAVIPEDTDNTVESEAIATNAEAAVAQPVSSAQSKPAPAPVAKHEMAKIQLDNASLLLYFGAFLFVAAAGLFVAFGDADGVVRTFVVVLVTAVLYASGIWLYYSKPKLKQAGQTFAGIGIVLAPLIGVAVYTYLFSKQYGMLVWMLTSLLCLGMYTHALFVFRSSLMSYLLIFTFVSLFESGVGVVDAPVYYYGWGLAVVALGLQFVRQFWKNIPELHEASGQGAAVLLPIAVATSLVMVPEHGATQLGVSLLFAAAFYGLEALRTSGNEQALDAVTSQVAVSLGVAALAYGGTESWFATGVSLLISTVVQMVIASFYKLEGRLWQNFGSVQLALSTLTVFVGIHHPTLLLASTLVATAIGIFWWSRQRREDAYGLAAVAWMATIYIAGQVTYGPLSIEVQTALGLAGLLVLLVAHLTQKQRALVVAHWQPVATGAYFLAAGSVVICSLFGLPLLSLAATAAVAVTLLILAKKDEQPHLVDVAGFAMFVPLLRTNNEPSAFLTATLAAFAVLVVLSIRYRREALRWPSTAIWLLLPVAFGMADVGGEWTAAVYAWAYVAAMVGLIISRAVASGVVYFSAKAPLISYLRSASMSYVAGYATAGMLAAVISLAAPDSRLHTTLILGVLGLTTIIVSGYVEKRNDILAILPVLTQAFLLSAVRPGQSQDALYVFLGLSSLLAIVLYVAFADMRRQAGDGDTSMKFGMSVAVATAFITPGSVLVGAEQNWLMAVGLLVAGVLVLYHIRASRQGDKELAGAIIVAAVWWLLYFANVHELQVYVHVLVATFGLYAYLRHRRGEQSESDMYLWAMLSSATIPLALQALNNSDSIYSWWFLFEQVAIMLLGMSINRKFVTRWGLYVAVGAVLWQLRGLGYAALGFLAVFLIALAVYKLQKYNDIKKDPKV